MSKLRRSLAIIASAMTLSSGALVLTSHAADQAGPAPAPQTAPLAQQGTPPLRPASNAIAASPTASRTVPTPSASNAVAPNPTTAKPPAAKPPVPGAPQVPEESATIRDDPTIAPDPKQSADNSVSFPNDT
jgi:hypothetical protein